MTNTKTLNRSYRTSRLIDSILSHVGLILLVVIWLIPIVWIVAASFREGDGMMTQTFFPEVWTTDNYKRLFTETEGVKFVDWMINTFLIAICNTVLTTFFTLSTAYALSRFRFRLRKTLMNIALILGMFPGFMAMIAVYMILNKLGLVGNIWSLLLVYVCGAGMGFFVSKGYFDTLPRELDEAASIDGANQFTIFFRIFLPLSKPIAIYTALMAFMAPWTDYILAGLILRKPEQMTVAVGLYAMTDVQKINTQFTMFAAGCVIVAIPAIILYIVLQRFMIEGISSGAVKG